MPRGPQREVDVGAVQVPVPITSEALIPFVNGALNSSTRSDPESETQRLPDPSKVTPLGLHSEAAELVTQLLEV